ncbi:fatty acid desaturase family protein [Sphingobium fontiphilum]|nr:fatty acid desaturase [Sphingobium fontiphilum]
MLRAAARLNKELGRHNRLLYWTDCFGSAALGYGALALTILAKPLWLALAAAAVAMLALYRATLFIHEISHMKPGAVPGFRTAWNALIGVPMMVPSFMYEGVHTLHHQRQRYGTAADPEYLPLSHMGPGTLAVFMLTALLAPLGFLIRLVILNPLSLFIPGLRRVVRERLSALAINPQFVRAAPDPAYGRFWRRWDVAASLFAITLLGLVIAGIAPLRAYAIYLGVIAGAMAINQVRTLVAHLWDNEGEEMSLTAQYLDSVNVPPPGLLPGLWAPVGLRYHALHHLLPGMPYHALGEAHRRLVAALPAGSAYGRASYPDLMGLIRRLVMSSFRSRARG